MRQERERVEWIGAFLVGLAAAAAVGAGCESDGGGDLPLNCETLPDGTPCADDTCPS